MVALPCFRMLITPWWWFHSCSSWRSGASTAESIDLAFLRSFDRIHSCAFWRSGAFTNSAFVYLMWACFNMGSPLCLRLLIISWWWFHSCSSWRNGASTAVPVLTMPFPAGLSESTLTFYFDFMTLRFDKNPGGDAPVLLQVQSKVAICW